MSVGCSGPSTQQLLQLKGLDPSPILFIVCYGTMAVQYPVLCYWTCSVHFPKVLYCPAADLQAITNTYHILSEPVLMPHLNLSRQNVGLLLLSQNAVLMLSGSYAPISSVRGPLIIIINTSNTRPTESKLQFYF